MNDHDFFDFALKILAPEATDAEREAFIARLAQDPKLLADFRRLQADARTAREVIPLIDACQASAGEFPAYARERLQTVVRRTLGHPESTATPPVRLKRAVASMPSTGGFLPSQAPAEKEPWPPRTSAEGVARLKRWFISLTLVTAMGVLVLSAIVFLFAPRGPAVELAMISTAGTTRGSDGSEVAALQKTWEGLPVQTFSSQRELGVGEKMA